MAEQGKVPQRMEEQERILAYFRKVEGRELTHQEENGILFQAWQIGEIDQDHEPEYWEK